MIPFIYAHPVVIAVQQTGTTVLVKHAVCNDQRLMGMYDNSRGQDELIICVANNPTKHSINETIKHEGWHVVQACNKGEPVLSKAAAYKDATAQDFKDLSLYEPHDHHGELEARNVARLLSDNMIVRAIKKVCR